jgi:hypothetical protein
MLKKMWDKIFSKTIQEIKDNYIIAQLNDKIMPIDRGEVYEDSLEEFLKLKFYGEITGGGTLQEKSGEIDYCDIEILLNRNEIDKQVIAEIIGKLEELGAPFGSKLIIEQTGEEISFGRLEGLAVYLDGVNLSDEVYKNSDTEALYTEIKKLTGIKTNTLRYWQGNTETAVYFYSSSFIEMKNAIADLIATNPECENARIVQIA